MLTSDRGVSDRSRLPRTISIALLGALLAHHVDAQDSPGSRTDLLGTVVDARGEPVSGVRITLEPTTGGIHRPLTIRDERIAPKAQTSDGSGEFSFARLPSGPWHLSARAPDDRTYDCELALPQRPVGTRLVVPLSDSSLRSPSVRIRVLTPAGEPVADSNVGVYVPSNDNTFLTKDTPPSITLRTDANGNCETATLPRGPLVVKATTSDGRVGVRLEVPRHSEPDRFAAVLVEPVGSIEATLDGVAANELEGSHVRALLVTDPSSPDSTCRGFAWSAPVHEGRATLCDLPVGRYALLLESPRGWCLDLPRNDNPNIEAAVMPWTAAVTAGQVATAKMRTIRSGALSGRITDASGTAIAGALVAATHATAEHLRTRHSMHLDVPVWRLDGWSVGTRHPCAYAVTTTDSQGRYTFAGLPPGLHQIEISAAGYTFAQHADVAITAAAPARLDEQLQAAGALQGVCTTEPYVHLAAIPAGAEQPKLLAILPNPPVFTLPGLAPGDWTLAGWRYGDTSLTPLGKVHVAAGRTSWVDLRSDAGARVNGRVLDARGRAVSGTVELRSQLALLQRDGSFAFELSKPLDQWPEPPRLTVRTENGPTVLPMPSDALGVTEWRGDFSLGDCSLAIHLCNADGRAIAGSVWLSGPQRPPEAIPMPTSGKTLHNLFAGHYRLFATAPDGLIEPLELDLQDTANTTLTSTPAAHVNVRVLDHGGRIVPGRHVVLQALSNDWRRLVVTDEGGVAHALVPPGPVRTTLEMWEGHPMQPVDTTAVIDTPRQVVLRRDWR